MNWKDIVASLLFIWLVYRYVEQGSQGEVQEVRWCREWWRKAQGQRLHYGTPATKAKASSPGSDCPEKQGEEPLPQKGLPKEVGGGQEAVEAEAVRHEKGGRQEPATQEEEDTAQEGRCCPVCEAPSKAQKVQKR